MTAAFVPPQPWTGRSDPEDGADAVRLHHLERQGAGRGLIGFACDAGVARNKGRVGARRGPDAIRQAMANLAAEVDTPPFTDLGTIAVDGDHLEAGQAMLSQRLERPLREMDRVIVLGGGHETAFASYCGLAGVWPDQQIGIINFDAHLDLRAVAQAGPSSGTPFYQIRALDPDRFDYLCLGIAEEANTAAVRNRARDWNVNVIRDSEIELDINTAFKAISEVVDRNDIVYLTIDMDVLPHFAAPGVSAPAVRGVPFRDIERLLAHVLECARRRDVALPLADIVEVCPAYDQDGVTARTAAYLARMLLTR